MQHILSTEIAPIYVTQFSFKLQELASKHCFKMSIFHNLKIMNCIVYFL